ncbi:MAG: heavy metal translocating P-type ATPase, partial [Patescibacteria group bacterium]
MAHTQTYKIKGMHCASCAGIIEKTFKKKEGVHSVQVNYATETAKVEHDTEKVTPHELSKAIEPLGYSIVVEQTAEQMGMSASEHAAHLGLGQSKQEKLAELAAMKRQLYVALPLAALAAVGMLVEIIPQLVLLLMATYMLFVVGKPYLQGVYRFARYGAANMDTLIGIGTSAAYLYSVAVTVFAAQLDTYINIDNIYFDVTIIVIAFITLGKYLESRSKLKTGDAIEKLLNLQAKTALVLRDGKEVEVPIEQISRGDTIIVKPAGKIPVDGVVVEGSSYVDEAMITGEPMPVVKAAGSTVVGGTLNTSGSFTFRATKVGQETLLAHIIKMVEEAQGSRAPIQALADKISSVFVPVVLVLAFVSLGGWLLVGTSYLGFAQALSFGLVSFVGILVIACPCALGLATPTAIIVGVGKGAKEGILIKDAATLQKLHTVNVVVLDKTGTLTVGKPEVASIQNFSGKKDDAVMALLAALEQKSEHPIAHAVVAHTAAKGISLAAVGAFEALKGKGLKGTIDGVEYFAGNVKLMEDLHLAVDTQALEVQTRAGNTPVFLAAKDKLLALVTVADTLKDNATDAVARLHKLGVKVVMLTGDDKNTASYIANLVGIDEVVAEVMPEDKLNVIKRLQAEGKIVAMAGDGVNDAPALAQADVGIAMSTGTDVAIETAGITLLGGDISKLVKAIALSKITMRGIKQNLFWAFAYNVVGIPLAGGLFYPVFGWLLSPAFAGLAMAFSSVSV